MTKFIQILLLSVVSLSITACGGGGGSSGDQNSINNSKPDISISSFLAPLSATAGNIVDLNVTITNTGNYRAADLGGIVPVAFYLSQDNIIDPLTDLFIGWIDPTGFKGLNAGESAQIIKQLTLHPTISTGMYFIGAYVDPRDVSNEYYVINFPALPKLNIIESNESNNSAVSSNKITITGASTCTADIYEEDDITGHTISLASLESHNFCYDQLDRIKFDATAGNTYLVTVAGLKNTHITLRDSDGRIIDTAYESSLSTVLTWTASTTQTYYIEISTESIRKGNLTLDPMGNSSEYTVIIQ